MQTLVDTLNSPLPEPSSGMVKSAPQLSSETTRPAHSELLEEDFPNIQMDYPGQNHDLEYDPARDLFKAVDEQGTIIEETDVLNGGHEKKTEMDLGTPKPKTISANILREIEGLPASSPINDALMLDVAARMIGRARLRRPHLPRRRRARMIFREICDAGYDGRAGDKEDEV